MRYITHMTPLYLDIKDNVLQAGFEQILLKEDSLALTDDKSKAKCILSDHQKEADICPVLFLGNTPISIRDTLKTRIKNSLFKKLAQPLQSGFPRTTQRCLKRRGTFVWPCIHTHHLHREQPDLFLV